MNDKQMLTECFSPLRCGGNKSSDILKPEAKGCRFA